MWSNSGSYTFPVNSVFVYRSFRSNCLLISDLSRHRFPAIELWSFVGQVFLNQKKKRKSIEVNGNINMGESLLHRNNEPVGLSVVRVPPVCLISVPSTDTHSCSTLHRGTMFANKILTTGDVIWPMLSHTYHEHVNMWKCIGRILESIMKYFELFFMKNTLQCKRVITHSLLIFSLNFKIKHFLLNFKSKKYNYFYYFLLFLLLCFVLKHIFKCLTIHILIKRW